MKFPLLDYLEWRHVFKKQRERTQWKRNPPGHGFPELRIGAIKKKKSDKSVAAFKLWMKSNKKKKSKPVVLHFLER